jgi:putative redox protein
MALQAQLKWTGDLQFVGRAEDGPAVILDSRDGGTGPSPMQMVLMGVAGCTAMDVISILKKKRANVTGFQVNVSGERAEEHPKRFTGIHIDYVFQGTGIKSQAVEQAIQLSETKYCSAMASMNANITHSYRIEGTD